MVDPVIRKATVEHLELLLPLVAAYHSFDSIETTDNARGDAVLRLLEDGSLGIIWWADLDGRPIGYLALCYGYSIEFGGRDAFVDELFVRAEHRGAGIGGRLLAHARDAAAAAGVVALHLEVDRANAGARRFYERHGFETRGRFQLMSAKL